MHLESKADALKTIRLGILLIFNVVVHLFAWVEFLEVKLAEDTSLKLVENGGNSVLTIDRKLRVVKLLTSCEVIKSEISEEAVEGLLTSR